MEERERGERERKRERVCDVNYLCSVLTLSKTNSKENEKM